MVTIHKAIVTNCQALTVDKSDKMAAMYDTESVEGPYYLEKVSIPEDSEDGFEYEEISVEEESVTEEENLEAVAEVLRNRTEDSEFVPEWIPSSSQKLQSPIPEVVDDFLRNFLVKMGMNRTLDCFQTEWYEMLQKGTLKTNQVGFVPDIYTHNQLLDNELKNVQRERDSYKHTAFQAGETIVKLQKERDFHRLQHKRVVQEKNRLIEDIRRLKKHYESYAPALKQLNEKYQTALRQKMLVSIEKDRVSSQVHNLDSALCNARSSPGARRFLKENDLQNGRSPERGTKPSVDEVVTYDPSKDPTKNTTTKHSKDSEFPASTRINPFLPQIKALSAQNTKISGFSVTKSIKAHTMAVSYLALHPRKLLVASASDDHLWRLWGMPEGEMIMTGEGHTDWLSSCSFHPSGHCLATTSGDSTVKIWDFAKSRCVLTLEGHTHATWGCSFHSCGDFVASCSMDNTGKVWDLNSERCRYTLRGHVDSVNSISFVPFSNILLTCSADKTISLWDARAGLCAQTFYGHRHSCNSATFNALGDMIASCDSYGIVKLWDVRNISAMKTVDTGPHPSNQVAFSPNGQVLAVASNDHEVKLVEVASSHVSSLLGHNDAVQSVIFDHKGEYLLSAGYDGEIFVWS
ncbi:sperm-associated antigen 16 protein [Pangasianodon hypophthalmus]|uniref:sperm-associated antigen 16 protein n=1 Tax=Pangasianodon hypophthalmus TaxID=310915 RepID=UPI0023079107|nr:sperm-associated antigen 16 protein [Pangasianodon hypophthalmus]